MLKKNDSNKNNKKLPRLIELRAEMAAEREGVLWLRGLEITLINAVSASVPKLAIPKTINKHNVTQTKLLIKHTCGHIRSVNSILLQNS